MKIALNWLREHTDWTWNDGELAERLTMSGTEVEGIHRTGASVAGVVTARIMESVQHPNADRLSVCKVDDGSGIRQIVCGAKNYRPGDIVPLATPGTKMPGGFTIKSSKLRGELSDGMLCSAEELGLPKGADGLLILPADTPLGKPIAEVLRGDTVFELEVTPNRADLLSFRGVARELSALGAVLKPAPVFPSLPFGVVPGFSIDNQESSLCPRYTAVLLEGVRIAPSPDWLRTRLESVGLRPLNNVVDITNYVLLDAGQPLHAFDADKLAGGTVQIRRAVAGETFAALDGKTYTLNHGELVIADQQGPVALAGVIGGERTAVTATTTRVLLESAAFHAPTVRAASRRHVILTDSSHRFERGIDPALVDAGRDRAAALIVELAGARVASPVFQSAPCVLQPLRVSLRPAQVSRLMGRDVAAPRIAEILRALGLQSADGESWEVPTFRPDLAREIDLVEEVVRIEGLGTVTGRLRLGVAPESPADRAYALRRRLRARLSGLGFHEAMTSSLLPAEPGTDSIRLLNPMNADNARLRPDLADGLLRSLSHNVSHGITPVKLFEIGTVYIPGRPEAEREEVRLGLAVAGAERPAHWTEPAREFDTCSMRGILATLLREVPGLREVRPAGDADPALLKAFGIKVPVVYAEWALPADFAPVWPKFTGLPAFPALTRDLCFVVDGTVTQKQIHDAILAARVGELEQVECFDRFEDADGTRLGPGKKSLTYALTYRSHKGTLKAEDVAAQEQRIVESVRQATGAVLRA